MIPSMVALTTLTLKVLSICTDSGTDEGLFVSKLGWSFLVKTEVWCQDKEGGDLEPS